MKMKQLLVFVLAALAFLLCTSALATNLPSTCPNCGRGYDNGYQNSADESACYLRCACGFRDRIAHTEETCERCGLAKRCNMTVTQLEGNYHRRVCGNEVCLRGFGGEGKVEACDNGISDSCYKQTSCWACRRIIPPSPDNHIPQLHADANGHWYQCMRYGEYDSRTGISCEYKTEVEPHSYSNHVCTVCEYIDPA